MTCSATQLDTARAPSPEGPALGNGRPEGHPSNVRTGSLRDKVIHGACWTILCSLIGKGVTFAGQVALAWFLAPEDFGLVALAGAITGIAGLLSAGSLQNVLIQRGERFKELAGHVFWLGLSLHSIAGLVVIALAPVAGVVLHEGRIVPLILVGALSIPLASLNYIYSAKLYIDLRFRVVTAIQLGEGILQMALAVALAGLGWGPYAIILPQVVVRGYSALACRWAAGPVAVGAPAPRQWLPLIRPGCWLMLSFFLSGFQMNAVFLVLGVFLDATVIGLFSWGYQVASQAIFLLVINLRQILVPALVRLNAQRERQRAAFYQAAKVMTAVAIPVCLSQALLAPLVVPWLFGDRWLGAVPVIVCLSLALMATPLNLLASSLLIGKSRNRAAAMLAGAQTALVVLAAAVGAGLGNYRQVTYGVAAALTVGHVLAFLVAVRLL